MVATQQREFRRFMQDVARQAEHLQTDDDASSYDSSMLTMHKLYQTVSNVRPGLAAVNDYVQIAALCFLLLQHAKAETTQAITYES